MENDPAHAKRLEDNPNRRNEFANLETTVAVPNEGRTDATKRARETRLSRHKNLRTRRELRAVPLELTWTCE